MNADGEENDDEWEEEEQLVVVHLSGIIDMDYLKKCDASNCKVLGIDTEEPAMQIDRMCFHGNYNESIGSNVIFEEQLGEVDNGEIPKNIKYLCHTAKNLDMIRVFLKNAKDDSNMGQEKTSDNNTAMQSTEEKMQSETNPEEATSTQMLE